MTYASDHKERLDAAMKLLDTNTTTFEKFESIKTLLTDLHPALNEKLDRCHKILSDIRKLQTGDVAQLSVENLSETNEKEKKRKKALLLFLRNWKDLKSEIARLQKELTPAPHESKWWHYGKIVKFAKGPFGVITLAALVIVGFSMIRTKPLNQQIAPSPVSTKQKIKVIKFNDKQIPLSELRIGQGPDCGNGPTPHYHALNEVSVTATDGTIISDPGACGYGKVSEVAVSEIDK